MERMNDRQRLLAEENIGLVVMMIGRLRLHYDFEDLKGVGSVGLCKAAASWRPECGTAFSTYACHLIRNELINYVSKNSRKANIQQISLEDLDSFRSDEPCFEKVESRELARSVIRNLGKILDEDEIEMVKLFLSGCTAAAAAKKLGLCSSSIVKSRARIYRKLRQWISDEGRD